MTNYLLTLGSAQTLLVTHNIDIALLIDSIAIGDEVEFNGVYEWNDEGGVIHWTQGIERRRSVCR